MTDSLTVTTTATPDGLSRRFAAILADLRADSDARTRLFRWLLVVSQGITLVVTYPLWQVRQSPPLLPALPLPAFDMGLLLLASLALILIRPLPGVIAHTLLLVYAMLVDQTRIQPEFISMALLMWGTLTIPGGKTVARTHLIALWVWAGTNKLLSPSFLASTGPSLVANLLPDAPAWFLSNGGYMIALGELATGVLAIFPRTRILAAVMAFGIHAGIFLTLSPVAMGWNESVWMWNIALAFAGFAMIAPWRESFRQMFTQSRRAIQIVVVILLLSPAGWFVGITDAYLAHHLYSSDVPRVSSTALNAGVTWTTFQVPMPPEHRLYEQLFRLTCIPGDKLTIRDGRWWFEQQGLAVREFTCTSE